MAVKPRVLSDDRRLSQLFVQYFCLLRYFLRFLHVLHHITHSCNTKVAYLIYIYIYASAATTFMIFDKFNTHYYYFYFYYYISNRYYYHYFANYYCQLINYHTKINLIDYTPYQKL